MVTRGATVAAVEQDELPAETREKLANLITRFVQPAGIEDLLKPKVVAIKRGWDDYLNNRRAILDELAKKGLLVLPDLKLTPEYLSYRNSQGGLLPAGEYAHLENIHRDGWQRFIEARVNATPDKVVLLTPENNILPNYDGVKLSKEQPIVKAPRIVTLDEASRGLPAALAEAMRLKEVRVGDIIVGVERQGIRYTGRMLRRSHLTAILRAQLLDQLPPNIDDAVIGEVKLYTPGNVWVDGIEAKIQNVPSIGKPGKVHVVDLTHVPIVDRNHGNYKQAFVTPEAVAMSYDFYSRSTSEKETIWPIKAGENSRKGDMEVFSQSTIFGSIRTRWKAKRELEGGELPGRRFIVLPMFMQIPPDAMLQFRKFYGTKTSDGATGGVILEEAVRSVRGSFDREVIERRTLAGRLVDLDIALHNLVAFAQYDLTPQRPKLVCATAIA